MPDADPASTPPFFILKFLVFNQFLFSNVKKFPRTGRVRPFNPFDRFKVRPGQGLILPEVFCNAKGLTYIVSRITVKLYEKDDGKINGRSRSSSYCS